MPSQSVLHFGGNGHAAFRLERAREALARRGGLNLVDLPYPGFEGRPRAGSLDQFLANLAGFLRLVEPAPIGAVASGIGALVALSLRSSNELRGVPLIFQGPVLWGIEHRLFPRLLRPKLAQRLLKWGLSLAPIQARFAGKHFREPMNLVCRDRFFAGYAACDSFGDFFDWFTPAWLRTLEARFRERPERLARIVVWHGGQDRVVDQGEIRATEQALGVSWPVVEHPAWGHYPAIDQPEEWADALHHALDGP